MVQSMTTMSRSQWNCGRFFKKYIELDGDEEVDTLPLRSSSATSRTQPASFFVSLSTNTLYTVLRAHPFSVTASLPESAGSSRFPVVSTSIGDDGSVPIGGAVAGCGVGGRAVERFSMLAPAYPSGALAVVSAIRKPGSRSCDSFIPRQAERLVWLTSFRAALYWAFSFLMPMGAVAEFGMAEQDCGLEAPRL